MYMLTALYEDYHNTQITVKFKVQKLLTIQTFAIQFQTTPTLDVLMNTYASYDASVQEFPHTLSQFLSQSWFRLQQ